ncbi:MAG: GNAT family N-acetyltransferase [Candidatus Xenobium sp.]
MPLADGVVVRPASSSDIPAIIDLAVEAVRHSVSPLRGSRQEAVQEYRRADLQALPEVLTLPESGIFVAEDRQGRLVGHVIAMTGRSESLTGEPQGWIFDLSVAPEFWGTGVARRLMERAEDFVMAQGLRFLGLGVTSSNKRALAFYERLGYLEERKQMVKILSPRAPEEEP